MTGEQGDGRLISGAREISQTELNRRAACVASGLAVLGVGENDAVALVLRNDFAFIEASFGANLIGAYAVPVNWHFTADEAGYILRDCAARVVVVHADLLPGIAPGIPDDVAVLVVATPPEIRTAYRLDDAACRPPDDAIDWDTWRDGFTPWDGPPPAYRNAVIYTSGTTGRPKGVVREPAQGAVAARLRDVYAAVFDLKAGVPVRTVATGPMYHSAPNSYTLAAAREPGGLVVLQPRFDAEELLTLIERYAITHLHMVPTMFVRLLALPDAVKERCNLATLRFVIHGAAPCPADVKRRMLDWWGPVIHEYYGSTEFSAAITLTPAAFADKPGSVGRPLEWTTVRIFDADGNGVPAGTIGDVYVRIAGFPDFTYRNRQADREAIERDGLITAGDMGYLDEDGFLYICDRRKDMIISGGVNIYPAEIEAVLSQMPGLRDCAVFGIPHGEYGETVCAHIQPWPGADLTADGVRAYLNGRIARYKVPEEIVFAADLPREDSGKIFKRKLRDAYWQTTGRAI
jgi:long-chain acyl-CoA synthetase